MKHRQFGNKVRTKKDKRVAALQFVVMSDRPTDAKVQSLVASYGFTQPEAETFVQKHGAA